MDWLEFISRSEWPIVVAGTILVLRTQLQALIGQISPTKLDAWGIKAEFERKLEQIEALTRADPAMPEPEVPGEGGGPNSAPVDRTATDTNVPSSWAQKHLNRYRHTSPETALIKGWEGLDRAIRVTAVLAGRDIKSSRVSVPLLQQIGLNHDELKIFRDLRSLRNRVAHADTATAITWEDASRFLDAIDRLSRKLKTAVGEREGESFAGQEVETTQ